MTRENKAGLVVSGSFLGLVGLVLALKLREPPTARPDPGGAVARAGKPSPAMNVPSGGSSSASTHLRNPGSTALASSTRPGQSKSTPPKKFGQAKPAAAKL